MRLSSSRSRVAALWLGVLVAGLAVGALAYFAAKRSRESDLAARAAKCAVAFRAVDLAAVTATRSDLERSAHREIKNRLQRLHALEPSARFIYILRHLPEEQKVVFVADSEPDESADVSLPGDIFIEAPQMPGLQSILRDGRPAVEGPLRDSFGNWVTGYARIGDASLDGAPAPRDILGVDIPAERWNRELLQTALAAAALCWFVLGLPVAAGVWSRQRSSSEALIGKLSGAIEQSESAIVIMDMNSRVEYANAGFCRQLGYTREELIGRAWREFREDFADEGMLRELVTRVRAGFSWEGLLVGRRKDGQPYPARAVVSPVRGADGRITGFIAVITDTSDEQRRERELRESKERAELADSAKGRFLATMSHEVRTPLNGIVGFTSLLLDTSLTPEQREYVQTIRTSGEALIQLTGDILDFSRIESGGLQLDPAPCDLRVLIEDVLDIFASKAAENDVQLLHWVEPDVPQEVVADAGRLRQVLVNLVSNAVKFTSRGEVEVTARLLTGKSMSVAPFPDNSGGQLVAELRDGGLTIEFAVRDSGIGIAPEDRVKLFRPFSQLAAPNTRRFGGAGLGLAISRNLVRLMGGDIRVEGNQGAGSTFVFTVRVRESGTESEPPQLRCVLPGRRVALVVASKSLRTEMKQVLWAESAEVRESELADLSSGAYDVAVVDCDPTLLAQIGSRPLPPGWQPERMFGLVPVSLAGQERQALRQHFRILLSKPVHHRTMISLIAKALVGSETTPAIPPRSGQA